MIYTAFFGTHQDAIKKGLQHHKKYKRSVWEVPYLSIDPKDIGRRYKDSIRINSQSGKSGVTYILKEVYGVDISKEIQTQLIQEIKNISQQKGGEVSNAEVFAVYAKMIQQ